MARVKDPEKRSAILQAAVEEIAAVGTGAATAKIARRAGIAAGSLFIYFASKEELLNALYLALKSEAHGRMRVDFPYQGSLEERARHIWTGYVGWAIEFPEKRKVAVQLGLSGSITPETLALVAKNAEMIDRTLSELDERSALLGLPRRFAIATMRAMQEATLEFAAKRARSAKGRQTLIENAFRLFWRAMS